MGGCKKNIARRLFERGLKKEMGEIAGARDDAAWQDYRRAAVLGNGCAQFYLAVHYAAGWDGHKSALLAMAWFKRALNSGEELCKCVADGEDVAPAELVERFAELAYSKAETKHKEKGGVTWDS